MGGKDGSVDYSQSPQQQQMFDMFMQQLGPAFGYENTPGQPASADYSPGGWINPGDPGYQDAGGLGADNPQPQMGPSTGTAATEDSWQYTGKPWETPQYPNYGYDNLGPQEQAGMWAPYNAAADQLGERMGSAQGSARGGYTGQAGNQFERFYADAGQQIGADARNMFAPAAANEYQMQNLPLTGAFAGLTGTYPNPVVTPPGNSGASSALQMAMMMAMMGKG